MKIQRFYSSSEQKLIFVTITYSSVRLRSERIAQKRVAQLAPGFVRERHILDYMRRYAIFVYFNISEVSQLICVSNGIYGLLDYLAFRLFPMFLTTINIYVFNSLIVQFSWGTYIVTTDKRKIQIIVCLVLRMYMSL